MDTDLDAGPVVTRVLLAEHHPFLREVLKYVLTSRLQCEVVGEAVDEQQAIAETGRLRPEIILMDIHLPERGGLAAARSLRARFPDSQVIILAEECNRAYTEAVLASGATACVTKAAIGDELQAIITRE